MAPGRTQRSTRGGLGLFLLAAQIMQIGTDRIPPVTLATVIVNAVIYMNLIPSLPSVHSACTSNKSVLQNKQWQRLLLSSFFHLDDMHLYYNMISFIWKGITLERQLKSRKFLIVICLFSVLTQVMMLGLNQAFATIFLNKKYLYTCAAGFSAVIFALKVVTTASSDNNVSVMGFPIFVPSRYACWVELVVIQILVPNASFTGHLAGILIGLLYTIGPLKKIVDILDGILGGPSPRRRNQTSYQFQHGATGYSNQPSTSRDHRNSDSDNEDEQLQRAIRESLRDTGRGYSQPGTSPHSGTPPSYGWNLGDQSSRGTPYPDDRNYDGSPPYPTSSRNNLYPDLSNYATDDSAYRDSSAPPAEEINSDTSDLPYPPSTDHRWKTTYQSDFAPPNPDTNSPNRDHVTSTETMDQPISSDELRRARLRRFDKN